MITITLDTSCLDLTSPELKQLENLKNKNKIELWIELSSEIEKENWISKEVNKIIRWIQLNTKTHYTARRVPEGKSLEDMLPWTFDKETRILKQVKKIHSPELKSTNSYINLSGKQQASRRVDWKICTRHILTKRDFFVTRDKKGFIGKNREKQKQFEKIFGIKIRFLDMDFIDELKKLVGE